MGSEWKDLSPTQQAEWKEHCMKMFRNKDIADKPMSFIYRYEKGRRGYTKGKTQSKSEIDKMRENTFGSYQILHLSTSVPNCHTLSIYWKTLARLKLA